MSITKTMSRPSGLFRNLLPVLLFLFHLILPETGVASSSCHFPNPDPGLKIACNSLNLLEAEKRSHGYSLDKRSLRSWVMRRDSCPNCPDPDKKMLAILMADRQGGSAQDYYDKLTDPDFVKKRVEKNTAGLISLGTLFVPWGKILGLSTRGVTNIIPKGTLANHLFKGANKLVDTPANRALITRISNGKSLGVDAYGKSWYAKTLSNGMQIYTYTQNGVIKGAGINKTPIDIIARYGLK